jgi:hypothetical protein
MPGPLPKTTIMFLEVILRWWLLHERGVGERKAPHSRANTRTFGRRSDWLPFGSRICCMAPLPNQTPSYELTSSWTFLK